MNQKEKKNKPLTIKLSETTFNRITEMAEGCNREKSAVARALIEKILRSLPKGWNFPASPNLEEPS